MNNCNDNKNVLIFSRLCLWYKAALVATKEWPLDLKENKLNTLKCERLKP